MTYKKQKEIICKMRYILMQQYEFQGVKINVNYISRAKHPSSWIINTHYHPWFEFNYVSKGSVYTTVDGVEFLVSAGESYLISPGVEHSHRNNKTGDDGICIRFSIDYEKCTIQDKTILDILLKPHTLAFNSNIDKLNLNGGVLSLQAEFTAWLMRMADMWNYSSIDISYDSTDNISHQVILYLNEYYNKKIKVDDLAAALNMSYRNLSRKFKAETGITISDKLAKIRIEKAKQLLLTTKKSMYDIAISVGFENEFYFSRKFKQIEKTSPKFYRTNV